MVEAMTEVISASREVSRSLGDGVRRREQGWRSDLRAPQWAQPICARPPDRQETQSLPGGETPA